MTNQKNIKPYRGECLCGSIKYKVDKIEPQMSHCHCTMCRKFHGAAFATYGEAKVENFRWLAGEGLLKVYRVPNGTKRQFCNNCGSSMTFSPSNDAGAVVEFALATLDTQIELRPDVHIYRSNAANWLEIHDKLPQYTQGRDSELLGQHLGPDK